MLHSRNLSQKQKQARHATWIYNLRPGEVETRGSLGLVSKLLSGELLASEGAGLSGDKK